VTVAATADSPTGAASEPPPESPLAPSRPAVTEACPLCGAPLDPRQDWCLSCGAAARTRLAATPNWKAPVAAIAVVAVLALGVLAAALVKLAGDSGSSATPATTTVTTAPAASTPVAPASTTPGVPTTIAPGVTTTPTATTTTPTVTAQPGNAGGIAGPSTTPTVTAKSGAGKKAKILESLPPSERKAIEERLKLGGGRTTGR
jgi:hypothetical protein